jgi:hypothetical protein
LTETPVEQNFSSARQSNDPLRITIPTLK